MKYCESIYSTKRWTTREVLVGTVGVGGDHPIRIQSMTTSDTRDVEATVQQILRLHDAGCEIARVTVQGKKEALACEGIKNQLVQRGCNIPLVADIHFYPPAALLVAEFADKVRINPGNFADRRASFKVIEYDDVTYARELEKIEEAFTPLIEKCKRLKKAMRIGTNHGSLSDRIMNRFGDSPRGMVESALEYARLCRKYDYHDLIFSMKASNPIVMVQAYRLLVAEMIELGWDYPLHLGVTEAGEGEDGRIKSAMGIGALLLDGIGDTIRVSLTEDPWAEIDPCQRLCAVAEKKWNTGIDAFEETHRDITNIERRSVRNGDRIAMAVLRKEDWKDPALLEYLGVNQIDAFDWIWSEELPDQIPELGNIRLLSSKPHPNAILLVTPFDPIPDGPYVVHVKMDGWDQLKKLQPEWILFEPQSSAVHEGRKFFEFLAAQRIDTPVVVFMCANHIPTPDLPIHLGAEFGSLFADQLGEGIAIDADISLQDRRRLSFAILQSARMRSTKTDFISCPGCGRTLFELQEVSRRIREQTSHLPGVKIAIMGCIVNGPGEMADADFGYVGSKPGKIDLYVGKTCVERDIDFADADQKLIALIAKHGKWVEQIEQKTYH